MTIYSIYKATNKVNGKSYIGFASRWPARQQEHYWESFRENHACYHSHFHRAIRKHGWESFEWELLYQSKDGTHTLKEMENFFILEHNTYEKGYNQTLGGDGSLGRKHSEETKAKIRAKRKLQVISDETKKLWSKNRKGKPKPQSMRDKLKGNQNWMGTKAS
jgi:group I intron endonuclease